MHSNQKIKICHLSSVHKATDTRIFYKECRSLAAEYHVTLIAQSTTSYQKDGVNIIGLEPPKNRIERFIFTDFVLFIKALEVNAKLYHFHDPELIGIGLLLKMLGKKIIYDVHEDVTADFESKTWLPFKNITKGIYRFFESLATRYFYLVLAENSYAPKYNSNAKNYVVIQNFVSVKDLNTNIQPYNTDSRTIALVGFLSARRGLSFILDALAILKNKGIEIKLRCIGEVNDDVKEILANSTSYLEIKDQVDWKGYIPFPQSIYAIQDCMTGMALPETLPNHQQSYPTKMFEYMAIGLPVITSDFTLYKEVVQKYDCGFTVKPEAPEAIANAIESIYLNKAKKNE